MVIGLYSLKYTKMPNVLNLRFKFCPPPLKEFQGGDIFLRFAHIQPPIDSFLYTPLIKFFFLSTLLNKQKIKQYYTGCPTSNKTASMSLNYDLENKSENLRRMNHFEKFNKANRIFFLQKMLDFQYNVRIQVLKIGDNLI